MPRRINRPSATAMQRARASRLAPTYTKKSLSDELRQHSASRVRTNLVASPPRRKAPEALPMDVAYKESAFSKISRRLFRKKPEIKEIVREPTSGGIVFRMTPDNRDIEILLIQDSKNRWTIPKGHVEPGENVKQTAIREIGEEAGLKNIQVLCWLGKIHFKYRRQDKLVLMTTQIYLVHSTDDTERLTKEKWMNGIKWFKFADALDAIEYSDIEKLMLIAKKRIRSGNFKL